MGVKYSFFEFLADLHRPQFRHDKDKFVIGLVFEMAFMNKQ